MVDLVRNFITDLNTFTIYGPNHTEMVSKYTFSHRLPFEHDLDPVWWTVAVFQPYWYHSITISVIYFILIKLIQKWMEPRKAFSLKTPLVLWNAGLAIFSIIAMIRSTEDAVRSLLYSGVYRTVCYSCNPNGVFAFWSLSFAISKLVELGDTLFIILRKRKLIFLHYYHHAAVLIYTAHSGAEHTAAGRVFVWMNLVAHSFMYSYYTVTALGYRPAKWVSMFVTTVQTSQMLAGVAVSLTVYNYKLNGVPCQQSMANLYLSFLIYLTFAFLFIKFFVEAYILGGKKKKLQ